LFRDQRQADQRAAPAFAATLAAAMTRAERRKPGAMFLRTAVAAVALVAVSVAALVIFRQSSTSSKITPVAHAGHLLPLPYDRSRVEDSARKDSIIPSSPLPPEFAPQRVDLRPPRHRPRITSRRQSLAPSTTLISQWQSPTDFLLMTPGEQLLKTVPRLRESSIKFKTTLPDEKN